MKNIYLLFLGLTLLFASCEKEVNSTDSGAKEHQYIVVDSITVNTTFRSNIVYHIHQDLIITNGATLTIQPGTVLLFNNSGALFLKDNGSIFAKGNLEQPIYFSSDGHRRSQREWKGFHFSKTENESTFEYCVFEYGGDLYTETQTGLYEYGLFLAEAGTLTITHSTFHTNGNNPIYLGDSAVFGSFHDNTFDDETSNLRIHANAVHTLGKNNVYGINMSIEIIGNLNNSGNFTWENPRVPFILADNFTIGSFQGTSLTLKPGIEITSIQRTKINIGFNQVLEGQLIATGTANEPIIFRGYSLINEQGYRDWYGLQFNYLSGNSELSHCIITNAGTWYGNIEIMDPLTQYSLTISNCLVQNSYRFGIYMDDTQATKPILHNNTFIDNISGDRNW